MNERDRCWWSARTFRPGDGEDADQLPLLNSSPHFRLIHVLAGDITSLNSGLLDCLNYGPHLRMRVIKVLCGNAHDDLGRWRPLFSSTYLKTCGEAGKVGCEVTQLLTRLRWVGSDDFKCAGADDQRIDVVRGSCVNCSSRDTSGYAARRASEMVHARSRLPSGKGRWQDVLLLPHRCGPPRGGRQPGGPLRSDAATFVAPIHEYQQHEETCGSEKSRGQPVALRIPCHSLCRGHRNSLLN